MDGLCNHNDAAIKWADNIDPACICDHLRTFLRAGHSPDGHIVLDGDSLRFDDPPFTSIATGSLQNKIFPPKREIWKSLASAMDQWHRRNLLPSVPLRHLEQLWSTAWQAHKDELNQHITHRHIIPNFNNSSLMPFSATRTRRPHLFAFSAHAFIITNASPPPSLMRRSFADWTPPSRLQFKTPCTSSRNGLPNPTHGPSALVAIYPMHMSCPMEETISFRSTHCQLFYFTIPTHAQLHREAHLPTHSSSFPSQFGSRRRVRPHQALEEPRLGHSTYPTNLQPRRGRLFHQHRLHPIHRQLETDTSFQTPTMSTHPDELFSVKPTTGNTSGDVVKGRTCRTLNVTRKIYSLVTSNQSSSCPSR